MKIIFDVLYDGPTLAEKRSFILEKLHQGECLVEFKKVNGEMRTMPCTLNSILLPPLPVTESAKAEKKENTSIISVWCTDKQAWRSFRVDGVISIDSQGA